VLFARRKDRKSPRRSRRPALPRKSVFTHSGDGRPARFQRALQYSSIRRTVRSDVYEKRPPPGLEGVLFARRKERRGPRRSRRPALPRKSVFTHSGDGYEKQPFSGLEGVLFARRKDRKAPRRSRSPALPRKSVFTHSGDGYEKQPFSGLEGVLFARRKDRKAPRRSRRPALPYRAFSIIPGMDAQRAFSAHYNILP